MKKAVIILLIILWISSALSFFAFDDHFYRSRPREPHPEAGEKYAYVAGWNKATVYLSSKDRLAWLLLPMSGVFAITAFVLNRRWKIIAN